MDSRDPYPGRVAHWVRHNQTERVPHRWIVADTEAISTAGGDTEDQRLRCAVAVRWRDGLKTGPHEEWLETESAPVFWEWVAGHCVKGCRTVLWFHNASYDLRTLAAFRLLPTLGFRLEWCNLDRDVSVATWRSDRGTLVIADTWTWLAKPLADIAGMVGIGKPRLPKDSDSMAAWLARCKADAAITAAAVRELLAFVRAEHLGNWQPSGAGMGYAAWRHRFMSHRVLVHDDAPALGAEREAMHAGRAEAWWHGPASGGPFTEWDMHMSYCRIAAECDVPTRLYYDDGKPSREVHEWARRHWLVLCRVRVTTDVPVVPVRENDRTLWPCGTFDTTLWQPELDLIRETGGSYEVLHQWRYTAAPALRDWAEWSMAQCGRKDAGITPVQQTFVKHQSRAMIGRLSLRNASWQLWGENPYAWCGLSEMVDGDTGETTRLMHVGDRTFAETGRAESQSSLPQITGYIMAEARCRLWRAAEAAGRANVLHLATDALIVTAAGSVALRAACAAGLAGGWRSKDTWSRIDVTGPLHYRASGRRCIPGVPAKAEEIEPGVFRAQVWESLATSLERGVADTVRLRWRQWQPHRFDGRRPWAGEGPAEPQWLPADSTERITDESTSDDGRAGSDVLLNVCGNGANRQIPPAHELALANGRPLEQDSDSARRAVRHRKPGPAGHRSRAVANGDRADRPPHTGRAAARKAVSDDGADHARDGPRDRLLSGDGVPAAARPAGRLLPGDQRRDDVG